MKNIISKLSMAVALVGAFSACTSDFEPVAEAPQAPLQITADIEGTRAAGVTDRAFFAKDSIGILVKNSEQSSYTKLRGDYDGSKWSINHEMKLTELSYTVNAYYPYEDEYTEMEYLKMAKLGYDFKMNAGTNHMVATATNLSNSSPMASLTFRHLMARVRFEVSGQQGNLLNSITISGKSVYSTAWYSFTESAVMGATAGDVTIQNTATVASSTQYIDALLIPGTTGEATVTFNFADKNTYTTTVTIPTLKQNDYYSIPVNLIDANGHDYVDLGLPSGTLWATCNVGAKQPWDFGDHFAWGETKAKENYSWGTYQWCDGASNKLTKYNTSSDFGEKPDGKTTLDLTDDAARVNWGGDWRMPTLSDLSELNTNCTWTWTTIEGVEGYKVVSKKNSSNYIFLPAAGSRIYTDKEWVTYYACSSLDSKDPRYIYYLTIYSGLHYTDNRNIRIYGQSVRPVIKR